VSRYATAGALTESVVDHLDRGRFDLPFTRRSSTPEIIVAKILSSAHPNLCWSLDWYGLGSSCAAVYRVVPSCSCYRCINVSCHRDSATTDYAIELPLFRSPVTSESTYLEKAPTAQLTRIDAADRLFSVSLTRITSVPECAVSSVGFLWGSAAVSPSCGVSVGLAEPTRHAAPRYRNFRRRMATFRVTQRRRSGLPPAPEVIPRRIGAASLEAAYALPSSARGAVSRGLVEIAAVGQQPNQPPGGGPIAVVGPGALLPVAPDRLRGVSRPGGAPLRPARDPRSGAARAGTATPARSAPRSDPARPSPARRRTRRCPPGRG
jgi:hypothetical protein